MTGVGLVRETFASWRRWVYMAFTDAFADEGYARLLLGKVTVVLFVLVGLPTALAEWDILPSEALLGGAPAIGTALLVDTFLFNTFHIRTGEAFWIIVYSLIYLQAVITATGMRWLFQMWSTHRSDGV